MNIESLTEYQVAAIEEALATWVATVPVVESPSESIVMPKEVNLAGIFAVVS